KFLRSVLYAHYIDTVISMCHQIDSPRPSAAPGPATYASICGQGGWASGVGRVNPSGVVGSAGADD
ncbi:MAG: hypothetical protein ACK4M3_06695, partial [Pyrobaculum sp.]